MESPDDHRRNLRRKILFGLAIVLAVICIYEVAILIRVVRLMHHNPDTTAFIERRNAEVAAQGKVFRRRMAWMPYQRISPSLVHTVILEEDPRFWQHHGVDRTAMWEALQADWKKRRLFSGASTIDQQLAKNLYLSPSKNPLRKLQEIIVAFEMETFLSKKRILEIYLNVIEWGDGIYGAEAAAEHYFHTSASALTPEQAAYLTAIIPGPRGEFNPARYPGRVQRRADEILEKTRRYP